MAEIAGYRASGLVSYCGEGGSGALIWCRGAEDDLLVWWLESQVPRHLDCSVAMAMVDLRVFDFGVPRTGTTFLWAAG